MFPWLPFFTYPDPCCKSTQKLRRRRRIHHSQPNSTKDQVESNGIMVSSLSIPHVVRIEYVLRQNVTTLSKSSIIEPKEEIAVETKTEASRQQKRDSFETSAAMLEIFGGGPSAADSNVATTTSATKYDVESRQETHKRPIQENGVQNLETTPSFEEPAKKPRPEELLASDAQPQTKISEDISAQISKPSEAIKATAKIEPPVSDIPETVEVKQEEVSISDSLQKSTVHSPQTPVEVGTPPAVRAARARQRAFQPSSDMLALFGGVASSEGGASEPNKASVAEIAASDSKTSIEIDHGHQLTSTGSAMDRSEPGPELNEEEHDVRPCSSSSLPSSDKSPSVSESQERREEASPSPRQKAKVRGVARFSSAADEGGPEQVLENEQILEIESSTKPQSSASETVPSSNPTVAPPIHRRGSRNVNVLSSSSPFYTGTSNQKEGRSPVAVVKPMQLSDPGPELPFDDEQEGHENGVLAEIHQETGINHGVCHPEGEDTQKSQDNKGDWIDGEPSFTKSGQPWTDEETSHAQKEARQDKEEGKRRESARTDKHASGKRSDSKSSRERRQQHQNKVPSIDLAYCGDDEGDTVTANGGKGKKTKREGAGPTAGKTSLLNNHNDNPKKGPASPYNRSGSRGVSPGDTSSRRQRGSPNLSTPPHSGHSSKSPTSGLLRNQTSPHTQQKPVRTAQTGKEASTNGHTEKKSSITATYSSSIFGPTSGGGGGGGAGMVTAVNDAQIINDDEIFAGDILIEGGIIKKISPNPLKAPVNAHVIEANGRWILPAGIDVHTQFSASSLVEEYLSGTKAALSGGTATIIDTLCPRETESLVAALDQVRNVISEHAQCNVGLSVVVPQWRGEKTRQEMTQLVREKGVNSFVLELSTDSDLFEALEHAKELGAHCRILPENKAVVAMMEKRLAQQKGLSGAQLFLQARPAKLEAEQIHRLCVLSQLTNTPFAVLSVTSSEASDAVRNGKKEGAMITAEVPIAAISQGSDSSKAALTRIPLRPHPSNAEDVLELLANSPLSMCVSDYSVSKPASLMNGAVKNGLTGVSNYAIIEQRMSILWEKAVVQLGRFDPMRFVAVTSSNAAKMFNMYPKKGRIAVGSDADVVLWDLDSSRQLSAPTTPFDGLTVHATPVATICAGRLEAKSGQVPKIERKQDLFLPLLPNSPYVFGMVHLREKTFNLSLQANRNKPEQEIYESEQSRRTSIASSSCSGIVDERARSAGSSSSAAAQKATTPATRTALSGSRNRNIQSTDQPKRSATKVIHPPGGKTSGFW
ncbi:amidohydrolase family domain-containing protein [Ditylenchus destructor]|uniref:Amidohydrolase family domain-containing protein n=1 Tax=Ditylenchus destructor TaxID=166010 RepID=A0AAD4N2C4_9BILA|nr:amidohydrolase family domain-containing protein [Ditylenchus destructor]